jgi:hypothetical protein
MKFSGDRLAGKFSFERRRVLGLTIVAFGFLALCNALQWFNVRNWGLGASEFLDLDATIKFVDCYETLGAQIYSVSNGAECSNYVYGFSLVAVSEFLGINHIPIHFLGYVLLAMLAYVIAYFLALLKIRLVLTIIVMIVVILSPPVSLLAQRANIDILIAFLILIGIQSIRIGARPIGFFLITLTVLIKFYTLPLLLLLLLEKPFRKSGYILSALVAFFATIANFSLIVALPSDGTYAAFGNRAVHYYLQAAQFYSINTPRVFGDLIGFITVIMVVLSLMVMNSRFKDIFDGLKVEKTLNVPNAFMILGISCYMFGMNYDYRLIFLILPLLVIPTRVHKTDKTVKTILVLTVAYTSFNSALFVQGIGDIVIGNIISLLVFLFLRPLIVPTGSR